MRRSTILIISILAMLLLAGSLMGFTANISIDTNYQGVANIKIVGGGQTYWIPWGGGTFTINPNSSNTQTSGYLNPYYGYTATVYASRVVNGVTITDEDSQNFHYGTATFTLTVDLSGNGGIPDDPPMQD